MIYLKKIFDKVSDFSVKEKKEGQSLTYAFLYLINWVLIIFMNQEDIMMEKERLTPLASAQTPVFCANWHPIVEVFVILIEFHLYFWTNIFNLFGFVWLFMI